MQLKPGGERVDGLHGHTRNLVELKIWTKYVLASKDNALARNREYDVGAYG